MKKTALITGAAGDIGSEVAKHLGDLGYRLILIDINQEQLAMLANQFEDTVTVATDLTNRTELSALTHRITEEFGAIDLAFINAGVVCVGNVLDLDDASIDLQLELNLRSAIHLIKACATNMAPFGSGHIIATVSMGGIISLKGSATYSASKFGLRGFLTAIKHELKPKGIHVSGIYPSGVDTNMLRYEANHGGSTLNFISTPLSVEDVGNAVMKAMKSKQLEVYIPYGDSISTRIIYFFPWSLDYLYPALEWLGKRGLKKYLNTIN